MVKLYVYTFILIVKLPSVLSFLSSLVKNYLTFLHFESYLLLKQQHIEVNDNEKFNPWMQLSQRLIFALIFFWKILQISMIKCTNLILSYNYIFLTAIEEKGKQQLSDLILISPAVDATLVLHLFLGMIQRHHMSTLW